MKHPPNDVQVNVIDNDVLAVEDDVWPCRQTALFRFPAEDDSSRFDNEWLVDYNCKNGDAGGLPGYPIEFENGDANVPGDRMCEDFHAGPYCETCVQGYTLEWDGTCRRLTDAELAALEALGQEVLEEEGEEESGR